MSVGNDQFGVYVDTSHQYIWAVHFNRTTRAIVGGPYALIFVTGNPLSLPLDTPDTHEGPSMAVDADGHIWVAGNMWGTPTARMVRSTNPLDVTAWTDASSQIPDPTDAVHGYFNFVRFSDGELLLLTRQRIDSATPGHNPAGERLFYLAQGETEFEDLGYLTMGADGTEDAFYRNNAYVDRNDVVHLFGAWDREYGGGTTVDGFSYLRSEDRGQSWETINGTALTTPFSRTDASGVACRTNTSYDNDTDNLYSAAGTTLDASGYPCGVYSKEGFAQRIVRWNGSAWTVDETAGSHYGGGQNLNLINYRNDLWALHRFGNQCELRRHASPNEVANLGGVLTSGHFCWPDPVALMNEDSVEVLIADPSPRVHTFGDRCRLTA